MSYSQENDEVVLRMSEDDWLILLQVLGGLMVFERINPGRMPLPWEQMVLFVNRLNEGNPHFKPYVFEKP
ncbi:MAG: hypothetical protein JO356_02790 [Acidobacteria bacterium]|nr:hypothetical protein [Acidobacteriota bacterium]